MSDTRQIPHDTPIIGGPQTPVIGGSDTLVSADIDERARASSTETASGTPVIAGFTLEDRLGVGAFGEVWSATQLSTGQKVAVKILHQRSDATLLAMQREVTRLASVAEHPNIVTVHDASFTHRPPYLVTPLLATSLDRFVGETSPEQAVAWLAQMARALQYAHGKGIIHCDLKPANILLDDRRTVRVVDWGQAQVAGHSGVSMGTLWFMPPEQAVLPRADQEVVPDVTWDVYALGATLYQLLTRRLPRVSEATQAAMSSEVGARILDVYRERMASTPLTPIRELNAQVPADLASIVEHCLAIDPRQRYQGMGEIVDDLKRMRDRRPLLARPRTFPYLLSCFVRRNAVPVALSAVFLLTLSVTGAVSFKRIVAARNAAVAASQEATAARNDAVSSLAAFEHKTGLDLKDDPVGTLWLAWAAWHQPDSLEYRATAQWQLAYTAPLAAVCELGTPRPVFPHQDFATRFSPDGKVVALGGLDGNVRLWNVTTGQVSVLQHPQFIKDMSFSPDGSKLYIGTHDETIRIVEAGNVQTVPGGPFVALSPDGRHLAGGFRQAIHRFDARGVKSGADIPLDGNLSALAHAGPYLVAATHGSRDVIVYDAGSGARVRALACPDLVINLRVSPDGRYVTAGCFDGHQVAFSLADGAQTAHTRLPDTSGVHQVDVSADGRLLGVDLSGHARLVSDKGDVDIDVRGANFAAFSPDGRRFVVTSREGTVRVFDASSGAPVLPPFRHAGAALSAAFSPDGRRLVSQGDDFQARLWDLEAMEKSGTLGWNVRAAEGKIHVVGGPNNEGRMLPSTSFSPDGKSVVLTWGKEMAFRDAVSGAPLGAPVKLPVALVGIAFRPDGKSVVAIGDDGRARLFAAPDGSPQGELALGGRVLAFGNKGAFIASAAPTGKITLYDLATLAPVGKVLETKVDPRELMLSPDNKRLVVHGKDLSYQLWDLEKSTPITDVVHQGGGTTAIQFIDGGKRLAIMDARGAIAIADADTGRFVLENTGGQGLPGSFAASPDGKTLAVAQQDRVVRFYDTASGKETGKPLLVHDQTGLVLYTADGNRLVTAGMDHGVQLWDVATATPLSPKLLEGVMVWRAFLDASSSRLITVTESGYQMWPLPAVTDLSRDELTKAARDRTGLTLDARGEIYSSPIANTVR